MGWKVSCTAWGKGKQLPAELGKIQLEVTTSPSHGDTIPDAQHRPSTTHWLCAHTQLILGDLLTPPLS